MNCCNANSECTQGPDCPIRKQCIKETAEKFMKIKIEVADPYDDVVTTVKALIAFITVTAALTLLAFLIWGK